MLSTRSQRRLHFLSLFITIKILGGGAPCLGKRDLCKTKHSLHNLRSCRQTNYSSEGTSALIQNTLKIPIKLYHTKLTSVQGGIYIFSSDGMKAVKQNIATICCWLGKCYAMCIVTLSQVAILMWCTSSAPPISIYTVKC